MNVDISAIWSAVRYVVVAIGAFVVGIGWATADDWAALLKELDVIFAAGASVFAGAVGVYSRIKLIVEGIGKADAK